MVSEIYLLHSSATAASWSADADTARERIKSRKLCPFQISGMERALFVHSVSAVRGGSPGDKNIAAACTATWRRTLELALRLKVDTWFHYPIRLGLI